MRCSKIKANGEQCQCSTMKGQDICFFHSGGEWRSEVLKKSRHLRACRTRQDLIRQLNRDLDALADKDDAETIKLRAKLVGLLTGLMDAVDMMADVKKYVKKQEEGR